MAGAWVVSIALVALVVYGVNQNFISLAPNVDQPFVNGQEALIPMPDYKTEELISKQ